MPVSIQSRPSLSGDFSTSKTGQKASKVTSLAGPAQGSANILKSDTKIRQLSMTTSSRDDRGITVTPSEVSIAGVKGSPRLDIVILFLLISDLDCSTTMVSMRARESQSNVEVPRS